MRRLLIAVLGSTLACATPRSGEITPPSPAAAAPKTSSATPPATAVAAAPRSATEEDPYLWLEDVGGDRALTWVNGQNEISQKQLVNDEQRALEQRLLAIYDSHDKIPYASKQGAHLYNFWQDDRHVRGLWRRTSLAQFKRKEPQWEAVLDLDALARRENENWIWKGVAWLEPSYERCLVSLSRGGGDAVVVREFDLKRKAFVADGFSLPEAKSSVAWKDKDTIYVGTDFGPGSLTSSGYPRIAKEWKRKSPLSDAKTVFEGQVGDVRVWAERDWHQGETLDVVGRAVSFFDAELYLAEGGQLSKLERPTDVDTTFFADFVLFRPRSDWPLDGKTWPAGSLLAAPLSDYRAGKRQLTPIFTPTPNRSLSEINATKNALMLNILEDVHTQLSVVRFAGGAWTQTELPEVGLGSAGTLGYDEDFDDRYWFMASNFISPAKLELGDLARPARELIRTAPSFFRSDGLEVQQFFATSKDGTRVPYYQVSKRELAHDGNNPVLLTAYGGFEISLKPRYDSTAGAAWLERGGVFVQANIRGGGEYGPAWHEAALKHNRQRAYDDFIAVAEDLIARKVTQPKRLGIAGRSNGGLLMGVMLTQRPDLWGAVVCGVPLLDMKRYHKLLAGASWIGEYGDPDLPEDWAAIEQYSPYRRVRKDARYPRVLFTTSTRDDRVHPGHARKMVARMKEQGHDVLYFENTEGGHAAAANNRQRAHMAALEYEYLYQQLLNPPQP